mgnify:CR=1 FL=1
MKWAKGPSNGRPRMQYGPDYDEYYQLSSDMVRYLLIENGYIQVGKQWVSKKVEPDIDPDLVMDEGL